MDENPPAITGFDPTELPRCEVQNLQGCKILDGHCQLDCERKAVSFYPTSPLVHDPDAELFLAIDGDRLRLHGVLSAGTVGDFLRYEGSIAEAH